MKRKEIKNMEYYKAMAKRDWEDRQTAHVKLALIGFAVAIGIAAVLYVFNFGI